MTLSIQPVGLPAHCLFRNAYPQRIDLPDPIKISSLEKPTTDLFQGPALVSALFTDLSITENRPLGPATL